MGVGGRSAVSRKVFRAGHSHRRELRGLFDDALKSGVARALACSGEHQFAGIALSAEADNGTLKRALQYLLMEIVSAATPEHLAMERSEERRVGKECRSRW